MSAASSPPAGAATLRNNASGNANLARPRSNRASSAGSARAIGPGGRDRKVGEAPLRGLDMAQRLHDVLPGRAPGGIERRERRGDEREAEGLLEHRRDDEDLNDEPS